jgi:hypothetical protein
MALLLGLLALTPVYAAGVLSVANTVFTLMPQGRPAAISVSNNGDAPLYLDVVQQRVLNPGELPERRVAIQNVPQPDLLIPLKQLVVHPGQTRKIPVNVIFTPPHTTVWRVAFRQREALSGTGVDSASFVKLSVSYGVLIYHIGTSEKGS